MNRKSLVVIDIQNDITKNYRKIIDRINQAIDWAVAENMQIIYIRSYGKICATGLFSGIRGIQTSGYRQEALFHGLRRGAADWRRQTVHIRSFLKRVTGGIPGTWLYTCGGGQ